MTPTGQTDEEAEGSTPVATGSAVGSMNLDTRYGRTKRRAGRERRIAWVGGIAIVLVFAAWVVWVGLDGTNATIESRDIGHQIIDDRSAEVSYEISMAPGLSASCALQVQNDAHAIVGWKIVDVAAANRFTRTFTETVQTTELGVTGLIYRCWLS